MRVSLRACHRACATVSVSPCVCHRECVTVSVSPCVCHRECVAVRVHTQTRSPGHAGHVEVFVHTQLRVEQRVCSRAPAGICRITRARRWPGHATCGTHGCTRSPRGSGAATPELSALPRPRAAARTRLGTPGPSRRPAEPGAAPRHRISTRAAPGDKWELSEAPCLLLTFGNATAPRAARAGGSGPAGIVAHHLQLISSR